MFLIVKSIEKNLTLSCGLYSLVQFFSCEILPE